MLAPALGTAELFRPDDRMTGGAVPCFLRPVDRITAFFDGLELLDPGVVSVPLWRPDALSSAPREIGEHGGLARKP